MFEGIVYNFEEQYIFLGNSIHFKGTVYILREQHIYLRNSNC